MKPWFCVLLLSCSALLPQWVSADVLLLLPNRQPSFINAAELIKKQMLANGVQAGQVKIRDIGQAAAWDEDDLILPLGPLAAGFVQRQSVANSVLYTFVQEAFVRELPRQGLANWAAVVIDQPLERMVVLADALNEGRYKNKILLLHSSANQALAEQIKRLPTLKHAELENIPLATTGLAAGLESRLYNAGLLLAPSDPELWRGKNARWLLLQAYNYRVPILAYNPALIKAGAMLAIYSEKQAIAKESARIATAWLRQQRFKPGRVHYAEASVAVNDSIAQALHFNVEELQALIERIKKLKQFQEGLSHGR
ncbi:MAG: hypothetical protein OIF35_12130 [Cellvibrionaceae bacterium]|nr:hypothetical protein [Cellvibrionaceae bacterium]MCV6624644.1 hypothetical protein [Cellvibrionaceae bacterium]